jgi:hypothetical protein
MTYFIFVSFVVWVSTHCWLGVCLGISPINSLISLSSYITLHYPFASSYILQQFLMCLAVSYYCKVVMYLNFIHFLLFLSPFPPLLVSNNIPTFENMLYLSIYSYYSMIIFVFVIGSLFYIWENHVSFVFLNLAYFT